MLNKFSIYLTGFRKNQGTHPALLKMIETWKTKLNMGLKVGVIYVDLSKAFDNLNQELWLDQNAIEFLKNYLSNRYQCCKINNPLEDWRKILVGIPQGFILGPLLFNIFLNDIFFFVKKMLILVSMQTLTLCMLTIRNLETVVCNLRQEFSILSNWFYGNYMVLSPE